MIPVTAVGPRQTGTWANELFADNLEGEVEDVILEVQLSGVLGSGAPATSLSFYFPIQVCLDCGDSGFGLMDAGPNGLEFFPECPFSTGQELTLSAIGHGPCCNPQDFFVSCVPCGNAGQPCCQGTGTSGCGLSSPGLTCSGSPPSGMEVCPAIPNQLTETCQ